MCEKKRQWKPAQDILGIFLLSFSTLPLCPDKKKKQLSCIKINNLISIQIFCFVSSNSNYDRFKWFKHLKQMPWNGCKH